MEKKEQLKESLPIEVKKQFIQILDNEDNIAQLLKHTSYGNKFIPQRIEFDNNNQEYSVRLKKEILKKIDQEAKEKLENDSNYDVNAFKDQQYSKILSDIRNENDLDKKNQLIDKYFKFTKHDKLIGKGMTAKVHAEKKYLSKKSEDTTRNVVKKKAQFGVDQYFNNEIKTLTQILNHNLNLNPEEQIKAPRIKSISYKQGQISSITSTQVDGIPLTKFLYENKDLDDKKMEKIYKEMYNILNNLHKAGIYHLDFKPDNIMIKEIVNQKGETEYEMNAIDYGYSETQNLIDFAKIKGTPLYLPAYITGVLGGNRHTGGIEMQNINPEVSQLGYKYDELKKVYTNDALDIHASVIAAMIDFAPPEKRKKLFNYETQILKDMSAYSQKEIKDIHKILAGVVNKEDQLQTKIGQLLYNAKGSNGFHEKVEYILGDLLELKIKENQEAYKQFQEKIKQEQNADISKTQQTENISQQKNEESKQI